MTTTSHQRDTIHFTILVPWSYDQPVEHEHLPQCVWRS